MDTAGSGDDVLRRFVWTFRRRSWLPAVLAIGFGLAVNASQGATYQGGVSFYPVGSSPTLEAAELDPKLFAERLHLEADSATIRRAADEAADDVTIALVASDNPRSLRLTARGPGAIGVRRVQEAVIAAVRERRKASIAMTLAPAIASLEALETSIEGEVDGLRDRIAETSGAEGATSALLLERSDRTEHLVETRSKLGALRELVARPDELLEISGDGDVERVGGRSISILAAAALGATVGVGLVYLIAYRDRSTRSRADVAFAVDEEVLAVIPARGAGPAIARLAAMMAGGLEGRGPVDINLVPVGPRMDVSELASGLSKDASSLGRVRVHPRKDLDVEPASLLDKGPCVIVIGCGSTNRDQLRRAVFDLRFSGCEIMGVVIVGVPPGQMSWANRTVGPPSDAPHVVPAANAASGTREHLRVSDQGR